ncbi:MAG: hypothetical protein MZW92_36760 [Comamonadaceae bacterium]|nr:hypothetical protein [Comamonadaceae bacterium]
MMGAGIGQLRRLVQHRLQQGRGLVAHRLHRQALHAARADAGAGRPHQLPARRPAGEDDARAASACRCAAPTAVSRRSRPRSGPPRWGPVVVMPRAGPELDRRDAPTR